MSNFKLHCIEDFKFGICPPDGTIGNIFYSRANNIDLTGVTYGNPVTILSPLPEGQYYNIEKLIIHYTAGTVPYIVTGDGAVLLSIWYNQFELYANISTSFLTSGWTPGSSASFVVQPTPIKAMQADPFFAPDTYIPYDEQFLYTTPPIGIAEIYLGAEGLDNTTNAFTQIGNGRLDMEFWYTIQTNYNLII